MWGLGLAGLGGAGNGKAWWGWEWQGLVGAGNGRVMLGLEMAGLGVVGLVLKELGGDWE